MGLVSALMCVHALTVIVVQDAAFHYAGTFNGTQVQSGIKLLAARIQESVVVRIGAHALRYVQSLRQSIQMLPNFHCSPLI